MEPVTMEDLGHTVEVAEMKTNALVRLFTFMLIMYGITMMILLYTIYTKNQLHQELVELKQSIRSGQYYESKH